MYQLIEDILKNMRSGGTDEEKQEKMRMITNER
jgi:hypothetical protein